MATMHIRKSRLSSRQQSELIKLFVTEVTAGNRVRVGRGSSEYSHPLLPVFEGAFFTIKQPCFKLTGEVEADGSYFGGKRKRKTGQGANGKIAVFGLLKQLKY